MGNHLSFDASLKVKKSDGVGGYAMHVMRTADDGINHSNTDIDASRTRYNKQYSFDDGYGNTLEERYARRMDDYDARTSTGKPKPLRKDAVVLRPFVVQPPIELFRDKTMEECELLMDAFSNDALAFISENFGGTKNIIGACSHMDETSPHLHVAFMPMTDDGRLNQKEFFASPLAMKQMHQSFRTYMRDKGWDVETENKHEDSVRYELAEYKRNAGAINQARAVYTANKRALLDDERLRDEVRAELRVDIEHEVKSEVYGKLYAHSRNVVSVNGTHELTPMAKARCDDLTRSVGMVAHTLGDGAYYDAARTAWLEKRQAKGKASATEQSKHK